MQAEATNRRLVKFVWAAAIFFAWSLIQGAIITQEPVRLFIETGPAHIISVIHTHIGLMGWMSPALMAAIYYLVPSLSGKPVVWPKLIEWIFWIFIVCTAAFGVLGIIGGMVGGTAFAAGVTGPQLASIVVPYMMPAGLLCTISVIAGLMFVVQILTSLSRASRASS